MLAEKAEQAQNFDFLNEFWSLITIFWLNKNICKI